MLHVSLSTDGSVQKNRGGWSFVLRYGTRTITDFGAEWTKRGINYYETLALIKGLRAIPISANVTIYTDSTHVIHIANLPDTSHYFSNSKLWKEYSELRKKHKIRLVKVGSNRHHRDQHQAHIFAKGAVRDLGSKVREEYLSTNFV